VDAVVPSFFGDIPALRVEHGGGAESVFVIDAPMRYPENDIKRIIWRGPMGSSDARSFEGGRRRSRSPVSAPFGTILAISHDDQAIPAALPGDPSAGPVVAMSSCRC